MIAYDKVSHAFYAHKASFLAMLVDTMVWFLDICSSTSV
jgi:hypothetical protein